MEEKSTILQYIKKTLYGFCGFDTNPWSSNIHFVTVSPPSSVQACGICSTLQLLVHTGRRRQRSCAGPGCHLWGQGLPPCQRGLEQTLGRTRLRLTHPSVESRGHHEPDQTSIPLFLDSDFLPPEQKFNNEWWIGRPVKEDGVVGFVPSPVNLETILIRREVQARKAAKALAKYASLLSVFSFPLCSLIPGIV